MMNHIKAAWTSARALWARVPQGWHQWVEGGVVTVGTAVVEYFWSGSHDLKGAGMAALTAFLLWKRGHPIPWKGEERRDESGDTQ